jgi:hypothetical protein
VSSDPTAPRRVRLRPQDPFDLIRLLARSQSDPRKAIAELVQNSLDAGARRIDIEWFNDKGQRALSIHDDGCGVFPSEEREDALRRLARTIGHSHKRDLSPAQRREQLVLGQYGIGLIGFWSVGGVLEMKSRVGGGRALVLRLREDERDGEVVTSRSRLTGEPDTFTEITIRRVHEGAVNKIRPPRLQAYLANELRGQLLERDAVVCIRDRVARGRARKQFTVKPRPYLGQPLDAWRELEVPGFESARIELYLVGADEDRRGVVALSCGGTVVLDDLAELDGSDTLRDPWCSGRLEGVIDFPELHVAPGSRRGFSHDEPVAAFTAALAGLERSLLARLEAEEQRRSEERSEHLARDIRRVFRAVAQRLPEYEFFGVTGDAARARSNGTGHSDGDGTGEALGSSTTPERALDEPPSDEKPDVEHGLLYPPGPLARLELSPKSLRVAPLGSRRLRARTLDADGRVCAGEVELAWHATAGQIEPDGATALFTAPERADTREGTALRVEVVATQGDTVVEAHAPVLLVDTDGAASLAGVPDPRSVSAPAESWRSRVVDGRWEYNDAHRDYLAVAESETSRLRYLVRLFAKEVVLKNFGRPGDGEILERMIEVSTCLDVGGRR